MDWFNVLDFDLALANCHRDILGDWYRDPWGWPEVDWVVKKRPDLLVSRLNSSGVRRAATLDVAKENFGIRPAVVLDPVDRLVYQALVDRLSVDLSKGMRRWVYGWRLSRKSPRRGHYVPNSAEWERFREALSSTADWSSCALKTDVVSYFASIRLDYLADQVMHRTSSSRVVARLFDMLQAWETIPGRSGLPQRSAASAFLANVYLSPVDDILDHYGASEASSMRLWPMSMLRSTSLRWMDDIWLFGRDPGRLRRAQLDIQDALLMLGLNANLAKTDVLEGPDVYLEAKEIQHSAVDGALEDIGPERLGPLNELVDRLVSRPEHAPRTSVRFAATRMREHEVFERVGDFVAHAERMPHASDHLARLFRDSEAWRELPEWFLSYRASDWAATDWSVAQFGTMFPSSETNISPELRSGLAAMLASAHALPISAVAAQRLAAWEPDLARVAIREAARRADHPLQRRTLALAASAAGDERAFIRSLLAEFEENQPTLEMLKDRNWRPIKTSRDFESG